jgi:DNA-binding NarL/FixJ family response regulator
MNSMITNGGASDKTVSSVPVVNVVGQSRPNNRVKLTPREQEILLASEDGSTSHEIGEALKLSKRTVDFHLGNCFKKLRVDNRIKAVRAARALELI